MKFLNNFITNQPTTLNDQISSLHALIVVKAMRLNVIASETASSPNEEILSLAEKTQLVQNDIKNVIHSFYF